MALTEAWDRLRYHPEQARLWRTKARIVHVVAGRGGGKSELARRRCVAYLAVRKPWKDPRYFFALPTFGQCRRTHWDKIRALVPSGWIARYRDASDSKMVIKTVFGSTLFGVGMDEPARVEGDQYDGCVIDESSDQKLGVFGRSIRPALAHRDGWCWRIGVPKRYGRGALEFRKAFMRGVRGEAGMESYNWSSHSVLSRERIREMEEELDAKDFKEQVGGEWLDGGGGAFHAFTREQNVKPCNYDPTKLIILGVDFNVDPMAWVLMHRQDTAYGEGLEVFDEQWIHNTNTPEAIATLYNKYSKHRGGWLVIGDATGAARKSSATATDYAHIANSKIKPQLRVPASNPPVRDRISSCNALLCNAADEVRLFVDPRCEKLISDLENRALLPDGSPDDSDPMSGHITDALGYVVYMLYPVTISYPESEDTIGVDDDPDAAQRIESGGAGLLLPGAGLEDYSVLY